MKTKFSKEYIMSNRGCYSREQVEALSFINKDKITINDFIESEIPLKDKYWWLIRRCELTNKESIQIAVDLAEIALPIFESRHKSKAPRKAIELTKKWLRGEEITQKERNAYIASYASYTAYADDADDAASASYAAYADAVYIAAVYIAAVDAYYAIDATSASAVADTISYSCNANDKYLNQIKDYLNRFKI